MSLSHPPLLHAGQHHHAVGVFRLLKTAALIITLRAGLLLCQAATGELQLHVIDAAGQSLPAAVQVTSLANSYREALPTDTNGNLDLEHLPYGNYQITVSRSGFTTASLQIAIRSAIATRADIPLRLTSVPQSITVTAAGTLLNTDQIGSVSHIGSRAIDDRLGSIPGRSLQDLVNSQPGWLYEGNAVLHPRGSEYQTQYVLDGIPLTDNRSPSFGPEIEADDIHSINIYTAGIPAEYGRKMGGIIELDTALNPRPNLHGQLTLSGGSFNSASSFAEAQYGWGHNLVGGSASGSMTDRYLNPVVPQNYSNTGTLGDFSASLQRDLTTSDRLNLSLRHEIARYDLPNEFVQQQAGQRQTADNIETVGIASCQHTFSTHAIANLRSMVRSNANDFFSNPQSTPILILQHNHFQEAYFNATSTLDSRHNEIKFGAESDNTFLHENLRYNITDPTQFDPATPPTFSFAAQRPDLEQSAFAQDQLRLGDLSMNLGLRWDHYQLLLNKQQFSPRFTLARYLPRSHLIVHFSYDRVFQTPAFENILLSNSTAVQSINPNFLRLPVQPSVGDYYEAGISQSFFGTFKLDANYFRRFLDNYADDSQIDNTTISFPVAFRKAIIYGAEGKLSLPSWRGLSGFVSYSYAVGNAWYPVTGGLFLGNDATLAITQITGHIPDTQDQRNTVRGRVLYTITPRLWIAAGLQYDSGLPFEFNGDPSTVLAQYGPQVLSRINFDRGRIRPSSLLNASAGVNLYQSNRWSTRLQADGENLTNLLDVLDFGGLFSGNAIGPPRSFSLRLTNRF